MTSIILTLIAFGAMIFIHELGHYLAAIKVGVRVEKFYLGFDFWGLKLFKMNIKGTEYGIGIFPLGGYVKMAGQEDFGKANVDGAPDEFTSKNVWERAQILVAGVLFNFISAFVFSALALYLGYRLISPEIGFVEPGGAAWKAGLQSGDKIVSYDGIPITSFDSLGTEVALGGAHEPTKIVIERNGQRQDIFVVPVMGDMDMPSLGVHPQRSTTVSSVVVDSPAHQAGLLPGDELVSVDGKTLNAWEDLSPAIQAQGARGESKVELGILRDGKALSYAVPLVSQKRPMLGIKPQLGNQILDIVPNGVFQRAGVRKGMALSSISGVAVTDILSVPEKAPLGEVVFKGVGDPLLIDFNGDLEALMGELYFGSTTEINDVKLSVVMPDSSAEVMGLKVGDKIKSIKIGEDPVLFSPDWQTLSLAVSEGEGKMSIIEVDRMGKIMSLKGAIESSDTGRYILGLSPDYAMVKGDMMAALLWPFHMLRMTYKSMLSLVMGNVPLKHMSGPVGILKVTYLMAEAGLSKLVYLMALLSINLAFLNILPLPVLDGGHLLFCLIEWIKGSPVSEVIMEKVQYAGLFMLLSLFLFATWNDLMREIL